MTLRLDDSRRPARLGSCFATGEFRPRSLTRRVTRLARRPSLCAAGSAPCRLRSRFSARRSSRPFVDLLSRFRGRPVGWLSCAVRGSRCGCCLFGAGWLPWGRLRVGLFCLWRSRRLVSLLVVALSWSLALCTGVLHRARADSFEVHLLSCWVTAAAQLIGCLFGFAVGTIYNCGL